MARSRGWLFSGAASLRARAARAARRARRCARGPPPAPASTRASDSADAPPRAHRGGVGSRAPSCRRARPARRPAASCAASIWWVEFAARTGRAAATATRRESRAPRPCRRGAGRSPRAAGPPGAAPTPRRPRDLSSSPSASLNRPPRWRGTSRPAPPPVCTTPPAGPCTAMIHAAPARNGTASPKLVVASGTPSTSRAPAATSPPTETVGLRCVSDTGGW